MTEKSHLNLSIKKNQKSTLNLSINDEFFEIKQLKEEVTNGLQNLDKECVNQGKVYKEFLKPDDYYRNLIFQGSIEEVKNIKLKLELVHSRMKEEYDKWRFFRYYVSSLKIGRMVGIQLYFLVKDETSGKYLGIITLGSDFNNIGERDEYIGWDSKARNKNLKYMLNIKTCVLLQPFGFNYTGGKLMAMICFSREITELFIERMNHRQKNPQDYPILALSTTSLYGRGMQYDGLKCLKYVGLTKGKSSVHIPDELYEKCKKLCTLLNIEFGKTAHGRGKINVIEKLLPKLGLSRDILIQSHQRGIYVGYLYPKSNEMLKDYELTDQIVYENINLNGLSSIDEIFNTWLNKHAIPRHRYLKSSKRLKTNINLNITSREKNATYQNNYRKNLIAQKTEEIASTSDEKPSPSQIRKKGIEEVRKIECEKRKNAPSAYLKKTFHDKYDLDKLENLTFTKKNQHLKEFIPRIMDVVRLDCTKTNVQIAEDIGLSDRGLRSILDKVKKST
jgi:hypothetical protein